LKLTPAGARPDPDKAPVEKAFRRALPPRHGQQFLKEIAAVWRI
jgi:hypothetical protein